ncbi:MAG TPA: hypothetical protein P5038_07935 [Candidatus Paceibacterota bacterium]|nr:hypothetical protein [Candidatus Paceibacterota bacterium]
MSPTPLISHHLFVAAAGHQASAARPKARPGKVARPVTAAVMTAALEVLAPDAGLSLQGVRPARVASWGGRA